MTSGKIVLILIIAFLTLGLGFFIARSYSYSLVEGNFWEATKSQFADSTRGTGKVIKKSNNPADFSECRKWNESCRRKIRFVQIDEDGNLDSQSQNFAIILDPKSPDLDFKVNLPLENDIYQTNNEGQVESNYTAKTFEDLIKDQNSELNGKRPFAGINADFIDEFNNPQGLNISRGVEYSGIFANQRSSFGISGGEPENRIATIQIGKRLNSIENYNVAGGNGRFYNNGEFRNICDDIGDFACFQSTNRSMVATTDDGYVIFLVHQSEGENKLLPSEFDNILEGLGNKYNLGNIKEGMLFDGGQSPGIFYDNQIYAQNFGPIGSVFLIY